MPVISSYALINSQCDPDSMYHQLGMNYPKFFKMDGLCKVAMICAEKVMRDEGMADEEPKRDMSLVLMNSSSSIDSDYRFMDTIRDDNYFPSPALFAYTLANIVTGQLCIRYRIFGESSMYLSRNFDAGDLRRKVMWSFPECSLCGWVDCHNGRHEALMMMVRRDGDGLPFETDTLNELYKQLQNN